MFELVAAAFLALAPAEAQSVAPAPSPEAAIAAPDPAAIAAAERLLDAVQFSDLIERTVDAIIADQRRQMLEGIEARLDEPLPGELKKQIGDAMERSVRRMFSENMDTLRKGSALIYARHFTAAEIARLTEINSDPVMRKSLRLMPQIMAAMMALTDAIVQAEMPRLKADLKAVLDSYAQSSPDSQS